MIKSLSILLVSGLVVTAGPTPIVSGGGSGSSSSGGVTPNNSGQLFFTNQNNLISGTINPTAGTVLNNPYFRGLRQVKVLFVGDSMSDCGFNTAGTAYWMQRILRASYGDAGRGLQNFNQSGSTAFNTNAIWPADSPVALRNGDSTLYCSQFNFANADSGLGSGFMNGLANAKTFGFWYLTQPLGGNFTAHLSSATNDWGVITVNSYGTGTNLIYTNIPAWSNLTGTNSYCYFDGISGTNMIVGCDWGNTNLPGIHSYFFSWGNHALTNQLGIGTNALMQLGATVKPDLIIYHAKDNGEESELNISNYLITLISCFTNTGSTVFILGTPPALTAADSNITLSNTAAVMAWNYIPLQTDFPNAPMMSTNGYYADGFMHASYIGGQAWALDAIARMQPALSYNTNGGGGGGVVNTNVLVTTNDTRSLILSGGNVITAWTIAFQNGIEGYNGFQLGANVGAQGTPTANVEKAGWINGFSYGATTPDLQVFGYHSFNGYQKIYIGGNGYAAPGYIDMMPGGSVVATWSSTGLYMLAGSLNMGSLPINNVKNISIVTNLPCPSPVASAGFLWNSNNALYWVTTAHTNLLSNP